MKQFEITQKTIDGNTFYIQPFPAFTAANLSGEITSLILPLVGKAAPALTTALKKGGESSILDLDAESVVPALTNGLASVSGDRVESLLKKLLTDHKKITVLSDGEKEPQLLTEDKVNEIFCGDVQGLFVLAFEVIKSNYSGFFKKLGGRFGSALNALLAKGTPSTKNAES